MTAPKRSPLAAAVLRVEDTLAHGLVAGSHSDEVLIQAWDWNNLVRLASAVELVDAEERACNRAVVEALKSLNIPAAEALDAVDDDARSGRRPFPITITIQQARAIHEALAGVKR